MDRLSTRMDEIIAKVGTAACTRPSSVATTTSSLPPPACTTEFAQRVLSSQMKKVEQNQFNLFQTYFVVEERRCRVMIDGETCNNLASLETVEKLGLITKPHPHSYYVQ